MGTGKCVNVLCKLNIFMLHGQFQYQFKGDQFLEEINAGINTYLNYPE